MGADFIGTFIAEPTRTRDEALTALTGLTDDTLTDILDGLGLDEDEDDAFWTPVRDRCIFAVNQFYDHIANGHSREIGIWTIDAKRYIVTGGMSYGDTPTDAYDLITLIDALNITDAGQHP